VEAGAGVILQLRIFLYLTRIWKRADVLAELESDQLRQAFYQIQRAAGMSVGTIDDLIARVRYLRELEESRGR
jgi:hypothetical protein